MRRILQRRRFISPSSCESSALLRASPRNDGCLERRPNQCRRAGHLLTKHINKCCGIRTERSSACAVDTQSSRRQPPSTQPRKPPSQQQRHTAPPTPATRAPPLGTSTRQQPQHPTQPFFQSLLRFFKGPVSQRNPVPFRSHRAS